MKKGAYFVVGNGLESYRCAPVEEFQNGFWFCEGETHGERIRRRKISLLTVYHNAFRLFFVPEIVQVKTMYTSFPASISPFPSFPEKARGTI